MENRKISELLNDSAVSKFLTWKWIAVNDLSNRQYTTSKNIRFKTPMLRPDLWDYSDVCIVIKETINRKYGVNDDMLWKRLHLKVMHWCIIW